MSEQNLRDQLVRLMEANTKEVHLKDVRDLPPKMASRRTGTGPVAAFLGSFVVILGVGLVVAVLVNLGERGGSSTSQSPQETSTTEPATPEPTTPLPTVELGIGHLWPTEPVDLSPVDLSIRFVGETLGWEDAGGTLGYGSNPNGESRVGIQQRDVAELVDVISIPAGEGRVITEIGPPWAMGADVHPSQDGGTAVALLSIGDGVVGQVTLKLMTGEIVSESNTISIGASGSPQVVFPDVDPETVASVLIRYLDSTGRVIAANGDGEPPFTVDHG